MRIVEAQLGLLISPSIEALGYELWGVEYLPRGRESTLRIFIDSVTGISVEDCADVSAQVSALLDVENPICEEYHLEVSSPGVDRRLFHKEQYTAFVGEKLVIRLKTPFKGRFKYVGRLSQVLSNEVIMQVGSDDYRFPFDNLERVKIQPFG